MAPELFEEIVNATTKADIWSFGIITYNMFYGFISS
jgi:serine/threonine protein kinase